MALLPSKWVCWCTEYSWVNIGIWSRYRYVIFSSVFFSCLFGIRYLVQYFEIPRYSVSVFLKYWLKIANFWYPTSIWRPYWGWPRRNFTVPFEKLEWWGHQAMKKFDSKFGRFDTSAWQTDGQTDTARQQRPRYGLRRAVNIYAFSQYVVLIVCFCYSTYKRLFGLIHRRKD